MSSGRLIGVCAFVRHMQEKKTPIKLALTPHNRRSVEAEQRYTFTVFYFSFFFPPKMC